MRPLSPLIAITLAACTPFPELDTPPADPGAPYPRLAPISQLIDGIGPNAPPRDTEADEALQARVAALRARAAALRQPALTDAQRAALEDARDRRAE